MVHRKAFTEEEINLLLGDDQTSAMAHFVSPSTIVIGEKGYSEKWMYDHPNWAAGLCIIRTLMTARTSRDRRRVSKL